MATARVFAALRRLARAGATARAAYATHRVVTPPVPRWRVGDDAVTALRWLRKYLRHDGAGDARGRGARGGSAVHQLFRARVVRVGRGALGEGVERDARSLRRAGRARTLAPGEFLAVPIAREGWTWREYGDEDANGDGDATRRARDRDGASEALVEAIRARVLHADEHVTVVDKPPGLATTRGNGVDVSVYDLRHALDSEYVVHRLDRDTSGVLVLARTAFAANRLNAMFAKKSRMDFTEIMRADMERGDAPSLSNDPVVKTYWALTSNPPPRGARSGWIEAPLTEVGDGDGYSTARLVGGWRVYDAKGGGVVVGTGESMRDKSNDAGSPASKAAMTHFKVLASAGEDGPTLLELTPITGRKHQLRVHLAKALSSPIIGDYKYGFNDRRAPWKSRFTDIESADVESEKEPDFWRKLRRASLRGVSKIPLHLHARALQFVHPESGVSTRVVAEPPPHFAAALRAFDLKF